MRLKWQIAFLVAVFNDALDLTPIGALPFIGDLLDLVTSAVLWKLIEGRQTLITLIELAPGIDPLPIHTLAVTYIYHKEHD